MHSSAPLCASLICCLVFLLALRIKDLDLGLAVSLTSDDPPCLSFSGAGLAALLAPLLAETYALDRRFKPLESSVSRGNILESVRNERNISLMLMSSFAEHSRTFTLQQINLRKSGHSHPKIIEIPGEFPGHGKHRPKLNKLVMDNTTNRVT